MGKNISKTANLLETVAREGEKLQKSERRDFLKQGLLFAGRCAVGSGRVGYRTGRR